LPFRDLDIPLETGLSDVPPTFKKKTPAVIDEQVKACILSNPEFHGKVLLRVVYKKIHALRLSLNPFYDFRWIFGTSSFICLIWFEKLHTLK